MEPEEPKLGPPPRAPPLKADLTARPTAQTPNRPLPPYPRSHHSATTTARTPRYA